MFVEDFSLSPVEPAMRILIGNLNHFPRAEHVGQSLGLKMTGINFLRDWGKFTRCDVGDIHSRLNAISCSLEYRIHGVGLKRPFGHKS